MRPKRLLPLALLVSAALSLRADWKKPYFGTTPVGSWAVYKETAGEMKSTTTMTRLADTEAGGATIEIHMDYGETYPPVHNRYTLPKSFAFDRLLIDFMAFIDGGAMIGGVPEPMDLDAATVEAITTNSPQYGPTAKFKATETVGGHKADRYGYTVRFKSPHESVPSTTETGDLWLSADVPFGLVKQKSVTKDDAGNVTMTFERVLAGSGTKKK
jgi:hypothetical protein